MADQKQSGAPDGKPKYDNKPMPPPGGPYLGVVIAEGTKRTSGGTLKKWVKVETRLAGEVFHAFLDVYATERSANTYLKVWCHAFEIPIEEGTAAAIFNGTLQHKNRPVAYDVITSNKPKADGSPYYKACHPRRFGEPAPDFVGTSAAAAAAAPPALSPEEAARMDMRLAKETPAERQTRARAPAPSPQPPAIQPLAWKPPAQTLPAKQQQPSANWFGG